MTPLDLEESRHVVVVDSSVAFKWFSGVGEARVPKAFDLLDQHGTGGILLVVPAHLPAEVLNGLRYSRLDSEDVARSAAALSHAELVTVPLTAQLTQLAVEIAFTHDLTIHDALFPALATLLDAELVTADRTQARVTECRVRLLT